MADPPKRDAWASKMPEGACELTGVCNRPHVYALIVCPKSSCMQGCYSHVRRLEHGPRSRLRNAESSTEAPCISSGKPQCAGHEGPLEENGGTSICHGCVVHADHCVRVPNRLDKNGDAPTMP